MDGNTIEFDETKFNQLKKLYDQAVKDGKESFVFEGQQIVTGYAKYMIEYLQTQFKNKK